MPYRFTKIIATLGPATYSYEKIKKLVQQGVNLFRLNFSHGSHDDHRQALLWIRQVEKELGVFVGIIADLQGPKFRLGSINGDQIFFKVGDRLTLCLEEQMGSKDSITLPHKEIFEAVSPGHHILVDDGKMRLKIVDVETSKIKVIVETDGYLGARKGVNIPSVPLATSALTPKDKQDLKAALGMGADYIALSFVQRADDLHEARSYLNNKAQLLAKLETPSSIKDLDNILAATDAVMIARGDLGVELPCEEIPTLQRKIIKKCRQKGLPVVVATQMLESMIKSPTPTRAEASDVATAVYEGADAVMLSAESASGAYPHEAVDVMCRIINQVENDEQLPRSLKALHPGTKSSVEDAISTAARDVAEALKVAAIASFTEKGGTAKRTARQRPLTPIIGITPHDHVARWLTLVWGILPVAAKSQINSLDDIIPPACQVARKAGIASTDDKIIITAGVPFGQPGTTNLLRVTNVM